MTGGGARGCPGDVNDRGDVGYPESAMAVYDPPQPLWKRNTAAILDFVFAEVLFGVPLWMAFGTGPPPGSYAAENNLRVGMLTGWPWWLLVALVIAYFVVLGRTGGTVFQRLFGMTRAKAAQKA
jgi:hypothetical protein